MQNNDFLKYLPNLSDEEMKKYTDNKVKYFKNLYKINKSLGLVSPTKYSLPFYGFIANNIIIRYNLENDYYMVNDNSYLIEFFKYLQSKKIMNNNEAILAIPNFLESYLGRKISRLKRREDILNKQEDDKVLLKDINKLKGEYVATSLEYSILAQNILTFLGFDAIFLIGVLKKQVINEFYGFNIIMIDNNYYLFDFYNAINVYDKACDIVDKQPYQVKINNDDIDLFLKGVKPLVLNEYKRILTNHLYQQVNTGDKRIYSLSDVYV